MNIEKQSRLSDFVHELIATGRTVFRAEEAEQALGIGHGAFLDAAERLQRKQAILKLRQGFYVVVQPQFSAWGAPPPAWYIDALMQHEEHAYYVGLLKAAELHGATHQAVMEFQVVTAKRLPIIRAGRSLLVFYYRKDMGAVEAGIEMRKTETGTMRISSSSLTALDLLRYSEVTGGIDNVATVLSDLAPKIDPGQLTALSVRIERPPAQRLGYLLEFLGYGELAAPMLTALLDRGKLPWIELDRWEARNRQFAPEPRMRNPKWRIFVGREPQPDI